jgi:hypothetical protein
VLLLVYYIITRHNTIYTNLSMSWTFHFNKTFTVYITYFSFDIYKYTFFPFLWKMISDIIAKVAIYISPWSKTSNTHHESAAIQHYIQFSKDIFSREIMYCVFFKKQPTMGIYYVLKKKQKKIQIQVNIISNGCGK